MSLHILDALARGGFEQVLGIHDRRSGLRAFLAIHDTSAGPALGGVRRWSYLHEDQAVRDCLQSGCQARLTDLLVWRSRKNSYYIQTSRFRIPNHEIHGLDGLSAGAFDQIVECGQYRRPAGPLVNIYREITSIGSTYIAWIRRSILLGDANKRFVAVTLLENGSQFLS